MTAKNAGNRLCATAPGIRSGSHLCFLRGATVGTSRPPRDRCGVGTRVPVDHPPHEGVGLLDVPDDTKRILHNPCQSPPANGRRLRSSGHPARVACFGRDSVNGCRIRAKPRPSLQPTACATLREAPEMDTKSGTGCRSDACWKETVRIPSWRPDTRRRAGADLRRQAGCNLTIYVTACAAHQHDVING